MIVITKNNIYKWNYKRLLKNLALPVGIIYFLLTYFYLSNQDYLTMIGKI